MADLPPHIDRILKLLLLGGRQNPNPHERDAARKLAESLMAKHGLTLEAMRRYYRQGASAPTAEAPPPTREARTPPPRARFPDREDLRAQYQRQKARTTVELPFPGLRARCRLCGRVGLEWRGLRGPGDGFFVIVCLPCLAKLDPERFKIGECSSSDHP